jgi:hypothetical protein
VPAAARPDGITGTAARPGRSGPTNSAFTFPPNDAPAIGEPVPGEPLFHAARNSWPVAFAQYSVPSASVTPRAVVHCVAVLAMKPSIPQYGGLDAWYVGHAPKISLSCEKYRSRSCVSPDTVA